jgi:hypothetical protein
MMRPLAKPASHSASTQEGPRAGSLIERLEFPIRSALYYPPDTVCRLIIEPPAYRSDDFTPLRPGHAVGFDGTPYAYVSSKVGEAYVAARFDMRLPAPRRYAEPPWTTLVRPQQYWFELDDGEGIGIVEAV